MCSLWLNNEKMYPFEQGHASRRPGRYLPAFISATEAMIASTMKSTCSFVRPPLGGDEFGIVEDKAPTMGTARVIHGGGYTHAYGPAYIFYREGYSPDASNGSNIGYRLACCADFRDVQ